MKKPLRAKSSPRPARVGRPTKPGRARKRATEQPPPEAATLRDRAASHETAFVDAPASNDEFAERMAEDAVEAITSGEDETEAERGDGDGARVVEAVVRDDYLFDAIGEEDTDEEEEAEA